LRVFKGGCCSRTWAYCRAAAREHGWREGAVGIRLVAERVR